MYSITRWFEIDAGHRIQRHESKCANLHGHRYKIGITLSSETLDSVGRVMDYGEMKEKFGEWLDSRLDHGMILQDGDPAIKAIQELEVRKLFIMTEAPTAENLSKLIYEAMSAIVGQEIEEVVVYETPNCSATFPARDITGYRTIMR